MSLDLNQVAAQVEGMIGGLRHDLGRQRERVTAALGTLRDNAPDPAPLRRKIESSKTTWLVAGIVDGLDRRVPPPPPPPDFSVIAADGSHIAVDRHQAVRCFLLNISRVHLRYGSAPGAVLESIPRIYAGEEDLVLVPPDGRGREQVIDGSLLGARRSVEESRRLADLAAGLPAEIPTLALLDGTLMLWGLEAYPDFVTAELLDRGLLRELDRLRRTGDGMRLALASYISATRSTDVVNALRVAVCPHDAADCDRFCPLARKRDCAALDGLTDSHLFGELLLPGERSALFASRSRVVREHYSGQETHFFYLRLDDEIARVEMPQWVALDEERLNLTHSLIVDQCRRGDGYPVALSEAHEQAVVTGADRENFWALVEAGLVEEHLPSPTTGKSRSKRTRWV